MPPLIDILDTNDAAAEGTLAQGCALLFASVVTFDLMEGFPTSIRIHGDDIIRINNQSRRSDAEDTFRPSVSNLWPAGQIWSTV